MKYFLYDFCSKNRISKSMVKRIENRLKIIYPMDSQALIWRTEQELIKLIMMAVLFMAVILFLGRVSFYFCIAGAVLLYAQGLNSVYSGYDRLEIKLLKQFEKFIQDIRFQFRFDGMLEEALQEAVQNSGYEMSLKGMKMIESLNAWKRDESGEVYEELAPNHFFLTFYALCETVIFMGLLGVTIFPVFSIKLIEQWGIHNMPELQGFYFEIAGAITTVIITAVTLVIYHVIMKLKYPIDFDRHKSQWVEEFLDIQWINQLLMKRISKKYHYYYSREQMLKSIVYPYNIKELMGKQIMNGIITFIIMLTLLTSIGLFRISIMGVTYGGFLLGMIIAVCSSVIAYHYETINIIIRKKMLEINREEEVVRFQSIILILMYMDRVTVELIIEWMEQFALVFRNNLEMIADSLVYDGIQAFYKAKETISFLPYERILDCFIASDRVGISEAFSDILLERIYYIEKHKQENEVILNNKAVVAKTIAFIPLCLVIIAELIVPFVYFGLKQLSAFKL